VQRGQKTSNRDFAKGSSLLSMEETPGKEVTWSSGSKIDSEAVAKAFKLESKRELLKRSDAGPTSAGGGIGCGTIMIMILLILVLLAVLKACTDERSNLSGGRTGGGSFGGYSSGGGHK
jgi:hypothetical protein